MSLPLGTKAEVLDWSSECSKVQKKLEEQFPKFEPEHEVWHFFNAADIWGRESGYRDYQHRLMIDLVTRVRAG